MRIIMLNTPSVPASLEYVAVDCYGDGQPKITPATVEEFSKCNAPGNNMHRHWVGSYVARVVAGPIDQTLQSTYDISALTIYQASNIWLWNGDVLQATKNLVEAQHEHEVAEVQAAIVKSPVSDRLDDADANPDSEPQLPFSSRP